MSLSPESVGLGPEKSDAEREANRERNIRYIVLKLIASRLPHPRAPEVLRPRAMRRSPRRFISDCGCNPEIRCPADRRVEDFLNSHLAEHIGDEPLTLPSWTVIGSPRTQRGNVAATGRR